MEIPITLSPDGTSLDWADPLLLTQPLDNSNDLESYILMLLCTDRVAPEFHYGLQPWQRRGSWHDAMVGEFGSLFWFGTDANIWAKGSKITQIQRWAEMALQTVYDEAMILQPAKVDVMWLNNESVQIIIDVIASNGAQRAITYVLSIG